ncbi:MAG: hypothetical protein DBP02_01470 [gamma proteobacterium symbiont of Ctena orbiculata]|nr:MAG: hypothetical protein DBP01_15370 [gamma proteobacterium symbiont of Ctena orbiculata]PUB87383.1 MAG: hypothetical protein DBP02_01470 [gamma proteobacterium symbiont of Ctena orbiculata]
MIEEKLHKGIALVIAVFFNIYWFAPFAYPTLSDEIQTLLSWNTYGAIFPWPEWFGWVYFVVYLASLLGVVLFRRAFTHLFLGIVIFGHFSWVFTGAVVLTNIEMLVLSVLSALEGVLLSLIYFTKLRVRLY